MKTLLIAMTLASTAPANDKYGAFSPSALPTREDPFGSLRSTVDASGRDLANCATAMSGVHGASFDDGFGGTVVVSLEVDDHGRATDKTRVLHPIRGNAPANDCLVRTLRELKYPAAHWPAGQRFEVWVDLDCKGIDRGGGALPNYVCSGKYRGVTPASADRASRSSSTPPA